MKTNVYKNTYNTIIRSLPEIEDISYNFRYDDKDILDITLEFLKKKAEEWDAVDRIKPLMEKEALLEEGST